MRVSKMSITFYFAKITYYVCITWIEAAAQEHATHIATQANTRVRVNKHASCRVAHV